MDRLFKSEAESCFVVFYKLLTNFVFKYRITYRNEYLKGVKFQYNIKLKENWNSLGKSHWALKT